MSSARPVRIAAQLHPQDIEWGMGVEPDDLDRFLGEEAPTLFDMVFTQFTLGFNGPGWNVDTGVAWLEWRDRVSPTALG